MKTLDYTQLEAKTAKNVAEELQTLLADFQVFYTNMRGFHWNVKGRGFYQLHELFEKMYDDAAEKIDEIAERILMLGEVPAHNFSHYLKASQIKESGVVSDPDEIVKLILESLKILISQERKVLDLAAEGSDEVTVAMISDFLTEQEKSVWMLTSYLA
ncbi:MAG TPA: DNA starvation/stationary phase protection protein [Dysgonamonadaceae bacterium]|mgnify:FL=1|jgi:starvation-inducible DNA-binding protein|uniref:Dps family protein n=1 Tax=Seramator thermalis TaxID=2496270 RepID=UPI00101CE9DA|nr:DNA starvation/stationary phase protection protein [Seramator thermalis]MBP9031447.1 DNA starvation/stationary phase protection protein [Dysgonamonadaceae bacterium]MDN5296389.1 starvation-inducible DNA-binding protein [Bacteroidota bacterium]HOM63248.1 DNA starvation/stationary phase protection protein [Dysgonamonadaceae bacterium]HOV36191.1 DNA starvation/stationary phase protection protein [Dysgonamonadaceae bacterium]HPD43812.1 DNA starvation/stationary phase protection protein [Dysgona